MSARILVSVAFCIVGLAVVVYVVSRLVRIMEETGGHERGDLGGNETYFDSLKDGIFLAFIMASVRFWDLAAWLLGPKKRKRQ